MPESPLDPAAGGARTRGRERRSPREVQELILDSARHLFATRGYGPTTLRAVADHAGVAPSMIVRGIGTKAALFDKAVAEPFQDMLADYVVKYERRHTHAGWNWDWEVLARDYIEGLYDFLATHKDLGRALLSAYLSENDGTEQLDSPFTDLLSRLVAIGEAAVREGDLPGVSVAISVRTVFGMVMSMALLPDLFFEKGRRRPSRRRIIDEMVGMMVYGNVRRPADLA